MAKTIEAVFDASNTWSPVEEGTYPAHITELETKEIGTKAGPATVVNMRYQLAEEVKNQNQLLWKMDGYEYARDDDNNRIPIMNGTDKQEEISCSHLQGKDFGDNGFWIFASSSGKNSKYFQLLENLGVDCKEITDSNGNKVKQLVLLETEDVVGKPVMVTVKRDQFTTKNGEQRSIMKVSTVDKWVGGKPIDAIELEEEAPF
tara:strand:- start:1319 stop:1927 length:609 start_codon:yes stop_codon:yes gene_type:complete